MTTTTTEHRPRIGDRAFEVEWCDGCPVNEFGDADLDRADMRAQMYKTRAAAVAKAKKVFAGSFFGCATVTEMEFRPYDEADASRMPTVGFWEAVGDSEEVSE